MSLVIVTVWFFRKYAFSQHEPRGDKTKDLTTLMQLFSGDTTPCSNGGKKRVNATAALFVELPADRHSFRSWPFAARAHALIGSG